MTEEPSQPVSGGVPPQPPPLPPTPPSPGAGYGQPTMGGTGLQNFDPKNVNSLDWGIIGAGLVAFVFSTFSFFTYKVEFAGLSQKGSTSAWHGGLAPLAILLALLGAGLLAVHVMGQLSPAIPVRTVVLGFFALASLLLLLALFVVPGNTGGVGAFGIKINKGHGVGYWISLLAVLAGAGLSFKRFTDTGGKLPGQS